MYLKEPEQQTLSALPDGRAGIAATLAAMCELSRSYRIDPLIRKTAGELVAGFPGKDFYSEIRSLFYFVRDQIRYMRDIDGVETLQTPVVTLENRWGDCDDKSLLLGTLLLSIGHPVRFKAVGIDGGDFEHVYVETKLGSRWIALDSTEENDMGWEPPGISVFMIRHC